MTPRIQKGALSHLPSLLTRLHRHTPIGHLPLHTRYYCTYPSSPHVYCYVQSMVPRIRTENASVLSTTITSQCYVRTAAHWENTGIPTSLPTCARVDGLQYSPDVPHLMSKQAPITQSGSMHRRPLSVPFPDSQHNRIATTHLIRDAGFTRYSTCTRMHNTISCVHRTVHFVYFTHFTTMPYTGLRLPLIISTRRHRFIAKYRSVGATTVVYLIHAEKNNIIEHGINLLAQFDSVSQPVDIAPSLS